MAQSIRVKMPPLRLHQGLLYQSLKRWNCWVCHRRFGKTVLCLQILIAKAMSNVKARPRYAYIAPLYKQAKAIAWDYMRSFARQCRGLVNCHEAELRVDLPGDRSISLLGADNPDSLRGIYLDGVVLDEYSQMSPRIFIDVVRPALSDRLGWAIFIGTPPLYAEDHFKELYQHALGNPEWSSAYFRASDTGIVPEAELADARAIMGEEAYAREYECEWASTTQGAYYGAEFRRIDADGRIRSVAYDSAHPVYTSWDLGRNNTNAIWFFQPLGGQVRFVDYAEGSTRSLQYWCDYVRSQPYIYDHSKVPSPRTRTPYEVHYGPHDIQVTDYSAEKSRWGIALDHGIRFTVLPRGPLEDRIEAARALLDISVFDAERCKDGIRALRNYHREWDEDRKAFLAHPYHDWASNGADSFGYAAVGMMQPREPLKDGPPPQSFAYWRKQAERARHGLSPRPFKVS